MIRRVLAQARFETTLAVRQPERMLVVFGVPVGMLVLFSTIDVLPADAGHTESFLVPGMLALSIISTAMVSLGVSTGFERQQGVLKRLGMTPLRRGGLLAAKLIAVLCVQVVQVVVIAGVGLALGWRPGGSLAAAALIVVLGTGAFAGVGFGLAGRLPAEVNLAVSNAAFLVLLFVGGVAVPLSSFPSAIRVAARALPAEPLATGLRDALSGAGVDTGRLAILGAWAVASCLLATLTFRWD